MAIQFARVEYVSRSQGKNACCKSAYNARAKVIDIKTGKTYNFERMGDNVYHKMLLPNHVDAKFKNIETLTNLVEASELKKNSQLFREYVLALPDQKEITLDDKIELLHQFVEAEKFVQEDLGVQLDIHKPHAGESNWHAHLLVTTRRFTEDGKDLGAKARDLNPNVRGGKNIYVERDEVSMGALWKEIQNDFFKKKGLELTVDEISNIPGVHVGPVRMRGLVNRAPEQNISSLEWLEINDRFSSGKKLLDYITRRQAVFTIRDLELLAMKTITEETSAKEEEECKKVFAEACNSTRMVPLYLENGDETSYFTTVEVRAEEKRTQRFFDKISNVPFEIPYEKVCGEIDQMLAQRKLSAHQGQVLKDLLHGEQGVRVLKGVAGSGKSHVLGKLNTLLQPHSEIIALAPTHKAVVELTNKGYTTAKTIRKFLFEYKNRKTNVANNSLFVIDEAGMVGTESWQELSKVIYYSNSAVIAAGDDGQLTSIERGGFFSVLKDTKPFVEISELRRQKTDWGKQVVRALAAGNSYQGVAILRGRGRLYYGSKANALSRLLEDWSKSEQPLSNKLIITVANKNVDILNLKAREILTEQGLITGKAFKIESSCTTGEFAKGDRIIFADTDKNIGAVNGEFATILEASLEKFVVKSDQQQIISFAPDKLKIKHGYATNIFKSQGASIKAVYVFHSGYANKRTSYVKMSRHIEDLRVYCNRRVTPNDQKLAEQLGRPDDKISSLYYFTKQEIEERNKVKDDGMLQKVGGWFKAKATTIADNWHENLDYYIFKQEDTKIKVSEVLDQTHQKCQQATDQTTGFVCDLQDDLTKDNNSQTTATQLKNSTEEQATPKNRDPIAILKQELRINAAQTIYALLGEPNATFTTETVLRYGEDGQLAVRIDGPKAGVWFDFEKGKGGDLLGLIQQTKGTNFNEAIAIACELLENPPMPEMVAEQANKEKDVSSQLPKSTKSQSLYEQSKPLDRVAHNW